MIGEEALFREVSLTAPLLKVQVFPKAPERLTELVEALGELTEEDPLLDMEWEPEERELYLSLTRRYLEALREKVKGL